MKIADLEVLSFCYQHNMSRPRVPCGDIYFFHYSRHSGLIIFVYTLQKQTNAVATFFLFIHDESVTEKRQNDLISFPRYYLQNLFQR